MTEKFWVDPSAWVWVAGKDEKIEIPRIPAALFHNSGTARTFRYFEVHR